MGERGDSSERVMGSQEHHVVPRNDLRKHPLSRACHCRPLVLEGDEGVTVIHHAFDLREIRERMTGVGATGRDWGLWVRDE